MQNVKLPTGLKSIPEFPKAKECVINMVSSKGRLLPRPAPQYASNGIGICRGWFVFKSELYFVSGDRLLKISDDGSYENIGEIAGVAAIESAVGHAKVAIIVKSGNGYIYDGTTLSQVTHVDFKPSIDVSIINGRYFYLPADGSPVDFTSVNDPNDITGFFDAELLPDVNTGLGEIKNDLYVFGEESIEPFRSNASATSPFLRIGGASISKGFVSGKVDYKSTIAFLGKDQYQSYGIFVVGQGEAPKLSSETVDDLLNNEYTLDELKTCVAQRYQWYETDVILFHLPRHTLAFNEDWSIFSSGDNLPWDAKYIAHAYGKYYVGSGLTNKIGVLSKSNQDFGDDYEKGFDTFIRMSRGKNLVLGSLELDCLTGQSSTEYRLSLELSKDGRLWGDKFFKGLGKTGDYQQRIEFTYAGGLGYFENMAGVRFRTNENISFPTEVLYAG